MTALATLAAVAVLGLGVVKLAAHRRLRASLVAYRVQFPRGLGSADVRRWLSSLTGLLPPWYRRWLSLPFVVIEAQADADGIHHLVLVPKAYAATIERLWQAHLPGLRYEPVALEAVGVDVGAEYRLSATDRPLRSDPEATTAALLASLHGPGGPDRVVVQWVLAPAPPVAPARVASADERDGVTLPPGAEPTSEEASAHRRKQAHPLLLAVGRIAVAAATRRDARLLLRRVETAWHGTRAPGVHLRRRLLPGRWAAARTARRRVPFAVWPGLYNADELTGLVGWPVGLDQHPGLILAGCRPLAPAPQIPRTGTVIGDATFPGSERPLALDVEGRLRHVHVVGPTGAGKSVLLANLIAQDLEAGHGVVLLDPKGDLLSDVLGLVPAERAADVIVLDAADPTGRVVGLNPLRSADAAHAEVVVENLVGLFKSLYQASWGPRTDDVLRAALLTLVEVEGATLCEAAALLTNAEHRRRIVGRLDDPAGLESFWGWYEGLSDRERLNVVGPVLNKLRAFTMRPRVRTIIGQSAPALDMADVLAGQRVLLVSLASGLLGDEAAALLGALVVAELWQATTARVGLPPSERRPVMAYLDEWHRLLHLPTPMPTVLAEARGLGLGLVLSHQALSQLPDGVRAAVLANARSKVVFQLPADDARLMARQLGSGLTAEDLGNLDAFEVVAQLYAAGRVQPPATARTRPLPPAISDGDVLRAQSRQRYGADRADVEAALRARLGGTATPAPVGRRRFGARRQP